MSSESHMPFVSIITPFFNVEKYLRETIESVIHQEYTNWELILIDDGSQDRSTAIAKEYTRQYPEKIFYFEHEEHKNKAAAASRNLGLTKARGDLVAFLDADDLWLPQKLKHQVEIFQNNPQISMLCEAALYWYSWDTPDKKDIEVRIGASADRIYAPPILAKELYPLAQGAAPSLSGIILKKTIFNNTKIFEESFVGKYQVYEDQAFLIKIYLAEIVYISSSCNHLYRQRVGSVSDLTGKAGNFSAARYFFLQWLKNYLEKERINDKEINKLLEKALNSYKYPKIKRILRSISFRWKLLAEKTRQKLYE